MADDLTGFWQTMDKQTKQPTSVIAIYPYKGKYYGRIIATFNKGVLQETVDHPQSRAPGMEGNPYYCGLDIVWVVEPQGKGKYKGYVVDPENGKVYNAKLWREKGNLILRGEVFVFGRNEVWPPFPDQKFNANFKKPDLTKFVPQIHKVKG